MIYRALIRLSWRLVRWPDLSWAIEDAAYRWDEFLDKFRRDD